MGGSRNNGSSLNEKQQLFVLEYLRDLNATKAAIRAGYSEKTAYQQAHELLKNPEISAEIERAQLERARRTQVTADRVLRELAAIAFADLGDVMLVTEDGKVQIKQLDTLEPEARRAISEITQTSTERQESGPGGESMAIVGKVRLGVRHHSKVKALELLMDHLGMKAPLKIDGSLRMTSAKKSLGAKLDDLKAKRTGGGTGG